MRCIATIEHLQAHNAELQEKLKKLEQEKVNAVMSALMEYQEKIAEGMIEAAGKLGRAETDD